jgi:enamine deaminase RidA (YjgF/YER057c/UK114 family)
LKGVGLGEVRLINPESLAFPTGYSHAGEMNGIVWVAGQISADQAGQVLHEGDMAAQFSRALRNLAEALDSAGSSPESVVKLNYFVTDMPAYRSARGEIGGAYREIFGKHYPAATLVEVQSLVEPGAMVEIECVAVLKTDRR